MKTLIAYGIPLLVAAGLCFFLYGGLRARAEMGQAVCLALDPVRLSTPAPDFSLKSLDGQPLSMAAQRGKLVLLHFWATWCPPCLEELPSLHALEGDLRDPRFQVLTVSADDNAETVKKFLSDNGFSGFPVAVDTKAETPRKYGTEKFPETYLIDKNGIVRYRFINKRDWSQPEAAACIRSLL